MEDGIKGRPSSTDSLWSHAVVSPVACLEPLCPTLLYRLLFMPYAINLRMTLPVPLHPSCELLQLRWPRHRANSLVKIPAPKHSSTDR